MVCRWRCLTLPGSEGSSHQPTRPKVTEGHVEQNLPSLSYLLIPHSVGGPGNWWGVWLSSRTGQELENRR